MSKLFKLKEWLTLEAAAAHISSVLGEPATVADLYRFALDGHLKLSVDFVNHAEGRLGKMVKTDEVGFYTIENDFFTGDKLERPYTASFNHELEINKDEWLRLDKAVVSVSGVWDLCMFGGEILDVEHHYQQLTSGVEITLGVIDGTFIEQGDIYCVLQESYNDNEFHEGSMARKKAIEWNIIENKVADKEAEKLRADFAINREAYIKGKLLNPKENDYYPAAGLPEDCVFVVRTKELTRFIQSLEGISPKEEPILNPKERNSLLVLIGALCKEVDIDPKKRGVAASLEKMTENIGAPLSDDTIRKILGQIEGALDLRSK